MPSISPEKVPIMAPPIQFEFHSKLYSARMAPVIAEKMVETKIKMA